MKNGNKYMNLSNTTFPFFENGLYRRRLFVIEDDKNSLFLISSIFSGSSVKVFGECTNINIIPSLIDSLPIDLILLDIMLGDGCSGYDIFMELKADPRVSAIPVVAITSHTPELEVLRAQMLGMDGFISKPFDVKYFSKQLADIFYGRNKWIINR